MILPDCSRNRDGRSRAVPVRRAHDHPEGAAPAPPAVAWSRAPALGKRLEGLRPPDPALFTSANLAFYRFLSAAWVLWGFCNAVHREVSPKNARMFPIF